MATQADIADFISRRITVGRVQPGMDYRYFGPWAPPYYGPALPSAQQIAKDVLADAEGKGLQLGGFLNTPTGEFLEQAVEFIVPRAFTSEFDLIVAGLKLAADIQQGQKWGKALLTVTGTLFVGAVLKEVSKAA